MVFLKGLVQSLLDYIIWAVYNPKQTFPKYTSLPIIKKGIHLVGTLKQGYPLLQCEDAVPTRLSLVAW
jgi:hypothetical protein